MNTRLIHDVSFVTSVALLDLFRWDDDDERQRAMEGVYPIVKAGMLSLAEFSRREAARLSPMSGEPGAN
ncbi:MAG: hypothetical protein U0797_01035 [Gemmataceae bacterium]